MLRPHEEPYDLGNFIGVFAVIFIPATIVYALILPSKPDLLKKIQKRITDLAAKLYTNTPYVDAMANAVFNIDRNYGNVYDIEVGVDGMNIFYGNNSVTTVPFASIGLRDLEKSTRKNPHVQACAFALSQALGSGWGMDYTYTLKGDYLGTARINRSQEDLTAPGQKK